MSKKKPKQNIAGLINCSLCPSCCGVAYQIFNTDVRLSLGGCGDISVSYKDIEFSLREDFLDRNGRWLENKKLMLVRDENDLSVFIREKKHWVQIVKFVFYYLGRN
jgi:hypothetical protein